MRTPFIAFISGLTAALVVIWASLSGHMIIVLIFSPVVIVSILVVIAWVLKGWIDLARRLGRDP
jgi:hypothetical protein